MRFAVLLLVALTGCAEAAGALVTMAAQDAARHALFDHDPPLATATPAEHDAWEREELDLRARDQAHARELAIRWFDAARRAAAADRCDVVTRAELATRGLDGDFYAQVFATSPALAHCLGFDPLDAPAAGPDFDRSMLERALPVIHDAVGVCTGRVAALVEVRVRVAAAGDVTGVSVVSSDVDEGVCVATRLRAVHFIATRRGAAFRTSFELPAR